MSEASLSSTLAKPQPRRGFWAGAVAAAMRSPRARLSAAWLGLVLVLAVIAPLIASGHPVVQRLLDPSGAPTEVRYPLLRHLTRVDVLLLAGAVLGAAAMLVAQRIGQRPILYGAAILLAVGAALLKPAPPAIADFAAYASAESRGTQRNTYTLVPWSADQGTPQRSFLPPGAAGKEDRLPALLGTDALGRDVLSQLLHACRLSISIGLVSTGIAILIGVTLGASMGYFGGWMDFVGMRLIEIFASIPTLVLLVAAAAVLPRDTYVLMAVIGACSWKGAAKFTRAEFLRLKEADYVLAARAGGIGTRSIILRHILPAAVSPVLVEAGFSIASAILLESALSSIGLGPTGQASWGRLLEGAISPGGEFRWWLAVFPGLTIFLTVLAYNVLSQALRDATSPKDQG